MLNPFEDYRAFALSTAVYPAKGTGDPLELAYLGLGLTGEAGEVADCLKKIIRAGRPSNAQETAFCEAQRQEAINELGDVFWYAINLMDALRVTPTEVFARNRAKLEARQQSGTLKIR